MSKTIIRDVGLVVGDVDGEPVVLILKRGTDAWTSYSAIRFDVIGQRIDRILDYIHAHG